MKRVAQRWGDAKKGIRGHGPEPREAAELCLRAAAEPDATVAALSPELTAAIEQAMAAGRVFMRLDRGLHRVGAFGRSGTDCGRLERGEGCRLRRIEHNLGAPTLAT